MYNKPLVFIKGDGGKVKIDRKPLQKISEYLQLGKEMNEAGGVLLGRYIIDSNDIVVDDITTPMQYDVRKRCFFLKQKSLHQKIVTEKWNQSKGTCNYLGEWHTHPEATPTPSFIDKKEWKRLAKSTKFDGEYLYFLIAGTENIRVWEANRNSFAITQLEEVCVERCEGNEV